MEEDEIEMSREELQKWVRRKVKKNTLMISDVLEKCSLLQALLERREKQAAQLLRLCQIVSACEATVKKQYSLLGLKYRETDSDDDDDLIGCGNTAPGPPTANDPAPRLPKLEYSENQHRHKSKTKSLKREPVVVLTRLSSCEIRSLRRLPPPNSTSEDESFNSAGSDMEWEPQDDTSDSDDALSSDDTPTKRRKIEQHDEKPASTHAKENQASTSTDAKSNVTQTSTPPGDANPAVKSNATKASTPRDANPAVKSNATKASPPGDANPAVKSNAIKASTPRDANPAVKSNATKASTPPAVTNSNAKSNIMQPPSPPQANGSIAKKNDATKTLTPAENTNEATETSPSGSHEELKVNMTVLARQRAMIWEQGKITEILNKDGRLKYKVHFEDNGRSLISGHHIAFDRMPKLDQLRVGARVLVKRETDRCHFCTGILGELPSRKNRMRFMVFIDDHTAVYACLPLLRPVCRPLKDPLDDVADGLYKDFLRRYLEAWPHPPVTQYRVGQAINAHIKGELLRCEVKTVDCSLIEVVSTDQRTAWLYRGFTGLEHVISLKGPVGSKKGDGQNKSPKVDESSKSAH